MDAQCISYNGRREGLKITRQWVPTFRCCLEGISPARAPLFLPTGALPHSLSFSWDALARRKRARPLWKLSLDIAEESKHTSEPSDTRTRLLATLRDDLATPQALGILWDSLRNEDYTPEEKWGLIEVADAHLGLSLIMPPIPMALAEADLPEQVQNMLARREAARAEKDFIEADRLRDGIERSGYHVDDGPEGQVLTKRTL